MEKNVQEELEKSKRKRGIIRTKASKLITKIETLFAEDCKDLEILEELASQISEKLETLKNLDSEIEVLLTVDQIESETESAEEYQEKLISWKSRISTRVRKITSEVNIPQTPINTETAREKTSKTETKVRLPKLTIEPFNGDSNRWLKFWHQYKSSIHENETLTKIDKFSYLRALCTGGASNAINGFEHTSENYDKCILLLQERYARRDILISSHMNKLLNLEPVKHSSNILALRKLYDICDIQIRNLETLKVTSGSYGQLLCPILLKLIPDDLALEFNRQRKSKTEFDIQQLMTFFRDELECREASYALNESKRKGSSVAESQKNEIPKKNNFRKNVPSTSAFITTFKRNCRFCNMQHELGECLEFQKLTLEEKRNKIRRYGLCYRCMLPNHIYSACRSKIKPCDLCNSTRHNKHFCNFKQKKDEEKEIENSSQNAENPAILTSISKDDLAKPKNEILLQTASALACSDTEKQKIRMIIDSASTRSFVTEELVKRLNLTPISEETLYIYTFGSKTPQRKIFPVVDMRLQTLSYPVQNVNIQALVIKNITAAEIGRPDSHLRDLARKRKIKLADTCYDGEQARIQVLIGSDLMAHVLYGPIKRLDRNLLALNTKFGYVLSGVLPDGECRSECKGNLISVNMTVESESYSLQVESSGISTDPCLGLACNEGIMIQNKVNDVLKKEEKISCEAKCCDEMSVDLRQFWRTESLGITDDTNSLEDHKILTQFNNSIKKVGDRYEISLPFKDEFELEDNFKIAKSRFKNLVKRFKREPELFEEYKKVINEYKELGIVEKVQNIDTSNIVHYLPHHPIIRSDHSTTKMRIVYDGSSHENTCASLNSCLYSGPNLIPELLQILLRFRKHKIVFSADVTKAFLQICVESKQTDVLRFLWLKDENNLDNIDENLEVLRITRVAFGLTCSPFLLSATLKYHLDNMKTTYPETCELLNNSIYVDDVILGADNVEEAFKISKETVDIIKQAGMVLCKWNSNSVELKNLWEGSNYSFETTNEDISLLKVLGLLWNAEQDTFNFQFDELIYFIETFNEITKRNVLRVCARVYDPNGYLSPLIINLKCLIQEIWQSGLDWDDVLPEDLNLKWNSWCEDLNRIKEIHIIRHYFEGLSKYELKDVQLHCFSDASERAFGAVIYVRYEDSHGTVKTNIVLAKSRVAPLKRMTLPRLELLGALIGTRIMKYIRDIFSDIPHTEHFWTDSTVTMHWIKGQSNRWKPFVRNRVEEIQANSDPSTWNYCPGQENPADVLSRGMKINKLIENEIWFQGPKWLRENKTLWPLVKETEKIDISIPEEQRRIKLKENLVATCAVNEKTALLKLENYSSYERVIRVTAWIKRVVKNMKNTQKISGPLSAEEIEESGKYWLGVAQNEVFGEEINLIKLGKELKNSPIANLAPFIDKDNLLRVGGRLQEAIFSEEEKHPYILSAKHLFTELLIRKAHKDIMHSGVTSTLAHIRQKYYILKGRRLVKNIIRKCVICQKLAATSGKEVVAPLPRDRITEAPSFEVTGIDYIGPLYVKNGKETVKAYILLFTCAITRAVHLELVSNMTTENFILAFRRFSARRGLCKIVYSDNAKTFVRANEELRNIWHKISKRELLEYFGNKGIRWKFIISRAPWWGGFYERLVRTIKNPLKKILGKACLSHEEMETVLTEVEAVVNSRPLSYVYEDSAEPSPLTPAHFLVGGRLTSLPPGVPEFTGTNSNKSVLTRRLKYRQRLLDQFWKKWRMEYLLQLDSAHKKKPITSTELKVDDVVLIFEDKLPKHLWRWGRVSEVYYGRDSKVRSCMLQTATGTIKRPKQLLYKLELDLEYNDAEQNGDEQ